MVSISYFPLILKRFFYIVYSILIGEPPAVHHFSQSFPGNPVKKITALFSRKNNISPRSGFFFPFFHIFVISSAFFVIFLSFSQESLSAYLFFINLLLKTLINKKCTLGAHWRRGAARSTVIFRPAECPSARRRVPCVRPLYPLPRAKYTE